MTGYTEFIQFAERVNAEHMGEKMKFTKLFVCLLLLSTTTAGAATSELLKQLRSDYAALVEAEHDFHARRERGVLQGAEVVDYAAYVARLHRQVAEDCVALAASGIPAPPDISCPVAPAVLIAPVPTDLSKEQTGAEKTADLDAELFNDMSEFDEMLLREQERIKAATPHADGGAGGGGQGGDGAGGEAGSESGTGDAVGKGDEQMADGSGGSPTYGAGAGPGSSQRQGNNGAPPGTPDGNDDDVVARQLREAAEKETDPVLKKKLWEEYRKYKEGIY